MLEQHLSQLYEDLEFTTPPSLDENKTALVPLNSELAISIKELDLGYFFFSPLGACPAEKRENLFMLLMKANFLGQGTGGSIIALDNQENFLTLSLSLPYDMNYKRFKEAIEDFANFVDYWKEELAQHQKKDID